MREYRTRDMLLLGALTLLITAGHFSVEISLPRAHVIHVVLRILYLLPIMASAAWYGMRGGALAAVAISLLYIPHVVISWSGRPMENTNQIAMIGVYLLVGCVTGFLVDRRVSAETMRLNLARFLPPVLVRELENSGRELALPSRNVTVSILFADICGFTTLCERKEPQEIIELLGDFYDLAILAVFENHGTLDKFLGDAVLAVFGSPDPLDRDGYWAARAARDIQRAVAHHPRLGPDGASIQVAIGVSAGEVTQGAVGSNQVLHYTVIGDAVNSAQRLSDLANPGQTLVVSSIVESERPALEAGPPTDQTVAGKAEPLEFRELLDVKEA